MMYKITALLAFIACTYAVPTPVNKEVAQATEDASMDEPGALRGRELFPLLMRCAYNGCSKSARQAARAAARHDELTMMNAYDANANSVKGPIKALEMKALNDDLHTVVASDSMCTRRHAMARAAGLAAGLALTQVKSPVFAAETKTVKMGTDNGQLVFQPDELKICKGDTVTWVNNKGGPHNVVFDEEEIPAGVSQESISMDGLLGEEGETFSKKFDTPGAYKYYCEPHRGAGMNGDLVVE